MNKFFGNGRLTKDPEVRYSGQTAIARFTIASDRRFHKEGEQEADFLPVTAFGKTAEFIEKYFVKGMKILISGRVQVDQYKDKEGNNRSSLNIIAEEVEFGEGKSRDERAAKPVEKKEEFMDIQPGDEMLPFSF